MNNSRYKQIFNYLLEFSKLRNKTVRNIEGSTTSYPEIIWFSNIPNDEHFDNIIWHEASEWEQDYWLKAKKPKPPVQPHFPDVPEELMKWIVPSTLQDIENGPELFETIEDEGSQLYLEDLDIIQELYERFLDFSWNTWQELQLAYLEKKEAYEIQSNRYRKFFNLYNKTKRFGEEFELVIGLGLLVFKEDDKSPLIRRHILVGKADIFFDQEDGSFTVGPNQNGIGLGVESDMITDLIHLNVASADKNLNDKLDELELNEQPFSQELREKVLAIYTNSLTANSVYLDDLDFKGELPIVPTLVFKPAILLRKRNTRNLTAVYEKITQDLEEEGLDFDLPLIDNLINIENANPAFGSDARKLPEPQIIYFPKQYNKEQVQIVNRLVHQNKVLVQGPPGTGKSHTIANLISHLLAKGNRILVTAHTRRALEVLKGHLPPQLASLAVNLLSSDSSAMKDLEGSVNEILQNLQDLDKYQLAEKIDELSELLVQSKEQLARYENALVSCMEKDAGRHYINEQYEGQLIEITQSLRTKEEAYSWFTDEVKTVEHSLEAANKFDKFLDNFLLISRLGDEHFQFGLPSPDQLLSKEDFQVWHALEEKISASKRDNNFVIIPELGIDQIELLTSQLNEANRAIQDLTFPWSEMLINDCKAGLQSTWELKRDNTKAVINRRDLLANCAAIEQNYTIQYPADKPLQQLKADAETLLTYANNGTSLKGLKLFKPGDVKQRWYFSSEVFINGQPCTEIGQLDIVLKDLQIKIDLEHLRKLWGTQPSNELVSIQFKRYQAYFHQLETILNALERIQTLKPKLTSLLPLSLQERDYGKDQLIFIKDCISYSQDHYQWERLNERINVFINHCYSIVNRHAVVDQLIKNIAEKNYGDFVKSLSALEELEEDYKDYRLLQNQKEYLRHYFPKLIHAISAGDFDFSTFTDLREAILWRHAFDFVQNYLSEQAEENLLEQIRRTEDNIKGITGELAAKKGWLQVIERLGENSHLISHLQAWSQAVQKIGKTGRGKRAQKFRRIAQEQLDLAKDAVPCWIMPMYRVADTVAPHPGIFDYCIVDEASQLGADAIFLMYLAKRIIIVGDDKQTSPEYVGVKTDNVNFLIRKHLQDIPFKDYYGLEFSFFDHAKLFCNAASGGMLVLREHFRCMPEIIDFCNRNWYAPNRTPLYPMRQFSEDRLEPLRKVFVPEGYVEGKNSYIANRPEAKAIVNQIKQCIEDPDYAGKSFGVIVLQGRAQAGIIENLLIEEIGAAEIEKRNITCGFSTDFQGDERDVIFLSLVTAHNHNSRALTSDNDGRRFNVAVSRAKDQLWLFHSVQLTDLKNPEDLRYKLMEHFHHTELGIKTSQPIKIPHEKTRENLPEPFDSWFEVDVHNDIVYKNYTVIPQYPVGEFRIDLVTILKNGTKIAVECDGDKFHGPEQYQSDVMRQKALERCGWQFFRVRGSEYYLNPEKALEPLWELLAKNDTVQKRESPMVEIIPKEEIFDTPLPEPTIQEVVESLPEQEVALEEPVVTPRAMPITSQPAKRKIYAPRAIFQKREILLFTDKFQVYKHYNYGVPVSNIKELLNYITLDRDEEIIYICGTNNYKGYMLFGFENGKIAKVYLSSYQTETKRRRLKNAYSDEEKLVGKKFITKDIDLVAYSSENRVVLFNSEEINPKNSTTTIGVNVLKIKFREWMKGFKPAEKVEMEDPEYYRKGIPARGNELKPSDKLSRKRILQNDHAANGFSKNEYL